MKRIVEVPNQQHGSEFQSSEIQAAWSESALIVALFCLGPEHEWRVGEGFAVTVFEHCGRPALVVCPWADNQVDQQWRSNVSLEPERFKSVSPVISYLPKHALDASVEDAIELFRKGEGFIGRLGNAALYAEFKRSTWGMSVGS